MVSTIFSVIWFIIKVVLGVLFFFQSITFAIAYYEIANTKTREEVPSLMEFLSAFIVEYIVAFLNIIVAPLGYIEPDPLRELNTEQKARPVLLVHGYFMSRACFILLYLRMRQTGKRTIFTINLRPRTATIEELAHQLSEKIEEMLVLTKSTQVDLICHSMGGIVARYYIEQMNGAKKVNKLITLGSPHEGTKTAVFGIGANAREMRFGSEFMRGLNAGALSGEVKYYSLWSNLDNLVIPQESSILKEPGVSVKFYGLGHLTLLFSPRVFLKIMEILENNES
jgi:triacylglycerol esterase/lipase EstA (alpha/beta hydrolase family)